MITPTSTKSKQYQALGIDEIANDIETLFNAVNESGYTETIVNISSAQILAMGTTPIELLPAAGVGKYYDWYAYLEYTHNTAAYTFTGDYIFIGDLSDYSGANLWGLITFAKNRVFQASSTAKMTQTYTIDLPDVNYGFSTDLNKAVSLFTFNGTNPTLGDGTLRVKIYHKTITFGA